MNCIYGNSREVIHRSFAYAFILICLTLSGCLIVPFPTTVEPLPFPDGETSQIVAGVTSRQNIIDLLGEPDFEGAGSSLALYGDDRRVAGVFVAVIPDEVGVLPIKTGHLLVLRYDESETVQQVDLFRKGLLRKHSEICTTGGICIKPSISNDKGAFRILDAKFYDTPENDAGAKSFNAPPDQCAVYVYLDTNFWAGNGVLIHSVGQLPPKTHLGESGYFLWLRDSGFVNIVASDEMHSGRPLPPGKQVESNIELDCRAERAYIIKTTLRWDWGEGKHSLRLSLDEPTEGETAIRKRRLMIED